jgi:hypothetical protein
MGASVVQQSLHLRRTVDSAAAQGGVHEIPHDGAATCARAVSFGIDLSEKIIRYVDNNLPHVDHYA